MTLYKYLIAKLFLATAVFLDVVYVPLLSLY